MLHLIHRFAIFGSVQAYNIETAKMMEEDNCHDSHKEPPISSQETDNDIANALQDAAQTNVTQGKISTSLYCLY